MVPLLTGGTIFVYAKEAMVFDFPTMGFAKGFPLLFSGKRSGNVIRLWR